MIVFLDFEASSLGKRSFPIEVGWVMEDGREESHLIRPAPGWDDWTEEAERIHGIPLARLRGEGTPHDVVAHRMVEELSGHALHASAPSWDGKWLSALLRAAALPRHALRLRDTEDAQREAALAILGAGRTAEAEAIIAAVRDETERDGPPAHRALDDARSELERWREVRRRAEEMR
jgi:hypothetical protein